VGVLFPFRRVVRIVMSGLPPLPRISLRRFARSESSRLVNVRSQLRAIGEVVALVACLLVSHSLLLSLVGTVARKTVTPWWSSVLALLGVYDPSSLPRVRSGRSVTASFTLFGWHPTASYSWPLMPVDGLAWVAVMAACVAVIFVGS
jgi:hypothetical protein